MNYTQRLTNQFNLNGNNIMDIDFTQNIIQMKERDVLHKPFPSQEGYSLFEKTEEGKIVRMTFSSEESVKAYLNHLGYDWGNEGKNEFRNFDCIKENFSYQFTPKL